MTDGEGEGSEEGPSERTSSDSAHAAPGSVGRHGRQGARRCSRGWPWSPFRGPRGLRPCSVGPARRVERRVRVGKVSSPPKPLAAGSGAGLPLRRRW